MAKTKWQPSDCVTTEREVRDYHDTKTDKPMREIKTTTLCKLDKKAIQEGIAPLTSKLLVSLIEEALEDFGIRVKKNKLNRNQTREKLMPGIDGLRQLAKGIAEQEEEIEEACADGKTGNRLHNKSGEFVGYDDNWSWSLEDKANCGQAKMKPGNKRQYFTSVKCGRAAREQGKNIRCYDGKDMSKERKKS